MYPGRWNQRGTPMVYTSESLSLAALELLVHLDAPIIPPKYCAIMIEMAASVKVINADPSSLPRNWKKYPAPPSMQAFGSQWINSGKSVALKVPSVLIPGEHNYLLNPAHPDFHRLIPGKPMSFSFDPRLK